MTQSIVALKGTPITGSIPSGRQTYGKSPCSIGISTRYGHVEQQTVSLPGYSMSMIYVNIARSTIRLLYFETFHRMIAAYMWGHVRRYPWCTYIRDISGRRIDLYPSASPPRLIMKRTSMNHWGETCWNSFLGLGTSKFLVAISHFAIDRGMYLSWPMDPARLDHRIFQTCGVVPS